MKIKAIGSVHNQRTTPEDDDWDSIISTIQLDEAQFETGSTDGLAEFSHVEVVFHFDQVEPAKIVSGTRHPRNNPNWPKVGIFAQRGKGRPNLLGVSVCRLLNVDGLTLTVQALDAIDGTPVLDSKPVMQEFLPRGKVRQPDWSRELMRGYWNQAEG